MKKYVNQVLAATLLLATMVDAAMAQQFPGRASPVGLLMLTDEQAIKLEQLWDYVSGVRFDEEQKLGRKGDGVSEKNRLESRSRIAAALARAHREADKLLRPAQREILDIQREKLRTVGDAGVRLLLMSAEEFLEMPLDEAAARRWRFARDSYTRQSAAPNIYGLRGFGLSFGHGWHYGWHRDSHGTHIGWHHGHHSGHGKGR